MAYITNIIYPGSRGLPDTVGVISLLLTRINKTGVLLVKSAGLDPEIYNITNIHWRNGIYT